MKPEVWFERTSDDDGALVLVWLLQHPHLPGPHQATCLGKLRPTREPGELDRPCMWTWEASFQRRALLEPMTYEQVRRFIIGWLFEDGLIKLYLFEQESKQLVTRASVTRYAPMEYRYIAHTLI